MYLVVLEKTQPCCRRQPLSWLQKLFEQLTSAVPGMKANLLCISLFHFVSILEELLPVSGDNAPRLWPCLLPSRSRFCYDQPVSSRIQFRCRSDQVVFSSRRSIHRVFKVLLKESEHMLCGATTGNSDERSTFSNLPLCHR